MHKIEINAWSKIHNTKFLPLQNSEKDHETQTTKSLVTFYNLKKKKRRRWEFHYFLFLTVQKTNKSKKFLCVNKTPIYSTLFRNKGIFSNKIWRKEQIKVLFYFQDLMKFANIAEGFSKQLFAEEYMQKLYIKAFPYRWGRIKGSVYSK